MITRFRARLDVNINQDIKDCATKHMFAALSFNTGCDPHRNNKLIYSILTKFLNIPMDVEYKIHSQI